MAKCSFPEIVKLPEGNHSSRSPSSPHRAHCRPAQLLQKINQMFFTWLVVDTKPLKIMIHHIIFDYHRTHSHVFFLLTVFVPFPVICTILSNFCRVLTKPSPRVFNHWSYLHSIVGWQPFDIVESTFYIEFDWQSTIPNYFLAKKVFLNQNIRKRVKCQGWLVLLGSQSTGS